MPTVFAVSGRRRARCFSTPVTMIFTALITGGYLAHARDQGDACSIWQQDTYHNQSPCAAAELLIRSCRPTFELSHPLKQPDMECVCTPEILQAVELCLACEANDEQRFDHWLNICNVVAGTGWRLREPYSISEAVKKPMLAGLGDSFLGGSAILRTNYRRAIDKREIGSSWTPMQIITPIIAVFVTLVICFGLFLLYKRRTAKHYQELSAPSRVHSARPAQPLHTRTESSTSTVVTTSSFRRFQIAWANAVDNLNELLSGPCSRSQDAPERPSDVETVRTRERVRDNWSIDMDTEPFMLPSNSHFVMHGEHMHSANSLIANPPNSAVGPPPMTTMNMHTNNTVISRQMTATPEQRVFTQPLPQIRNASHFGSPIPSNNTTPRLTPKPTNGVSRASPQFPKVQIVSTAPRRGFKIDDVDSARSPDTSGDHGNRAGEGSRTINTHVNGVAGHDLSPDNIVDISRSAGRDLEIHSSEGDGTNALSNNLSEVRAMFSDTSGPFSDEGGYPPPLDDTSGIITFSTPASREGPGSPTDAGNHQDGRVTPPSPPLFDQIGHGRRPSESSPIRLPRLLRNDPALLIPQPVRSAGYSVTPRSSVTSLVSMDSSPPKPQYSPLAPPPKIRDPHSYINHNAIDEGDPSASPSTRSRPSAPSTTTSSSAEYRVPNPFVHPWQRPAAPLVAQNLAEEDEDIETPSRWPRNRNIDLAA